MLQWILFHKNWTSSKFYKVYFSWVLGYLCTLNLSYDCKEVYYFVIINYCILKVQCQFCNEGIHFTLVNNLSELYNVDVKLQQFKKLIRPRKNLEIVIILKNSEKQCIFRIQLHWNATVLLVKQSAIDIPKPLIPLKQYRNTMKLTNFNQSTLPNFLQDVHAP